MHNSCLYVILLSQNENVVGNGWQVASCNNSLPTGSGLINDKDLITWDNNNNNNMR